jgi:hypothetical protein
MSESFVGLMLNATRQNAGNAFVFPSAIPAFPGPGATGKVRTPAAMDCAEVIVVSGSERAAKSSHDLAEVASGRPKSIAITRTIQNTRFVFMSFAAPFGMDTGGAIYHVMIRSHTVTHTSQRVVTLNDKSRRVF